MRSKYRRERGKVVEGRSRMGGVVSSTVGVGCRSRYLIGARSQVTARKVCGPLRRQAVALRAT